jgi:hypothetical protein
MKKLILVAFLFISIKSFAQVTKADFETCFAEMGIVKFNSIFLNNIKNFYMDGTHSVTFSEYEGPKTTYELTNTSILLKYYSDNTKTTLNGVTAVPYISIKYFIAGKESMTILLKD